MRNVNYGCGNGNETGFRQNQRVGGCLAMNRLEYGNQEIQSSSCQRRGNCGNETMIGNNTIRIGTVRTGAPGTCASVCNSGTASNAVLNFTIPRGADGVSNTNTDAACSKAQMRNVLSQISNCFEGCEATLTFYDGSRETNLKLGNVYPECNPVFLTAYDSDDCKEKVYNMDSIAEVSVHTNGNMPNICYINCRNRYTNPIEEMLSCGRNAELILNGLHETEGRICKLADGMIVSTSNCGCENRINFTSTAAVIGLGNRAGRCCD